MLGQFIRSTPCTCV